MARRRGVVADRAPFAQLLSQTRDVPRVTALEADVARARGLAEQARARPNPSINVYAENFAGDLDRNARSQQQTTFQIDQPIELGVSDRPGSPPVKPASSRHRRAIAMAALSMRPSWHAPMPVQRSPIGASPSPRTRLRRRPTT
jgi:hypothetical protein